MKIYHFNGENKMRKIKFRAWLKIEQRMVEVTVIDFYLGNVYWTDDPSKLDKYVNISQVKLMQFTGLKDKNGVEIYEGDVVCMHNFYGGEDKIDVIGIVRINELGTYTETKDDELFWLNYWIEPEEELEVIGNVYEHPERLKESKHE